MVAAAVAGGAIVGGVASGAMSSSAAKSAAGTQADAANYAASLQDAQMTQTRNDLAPYRDLGTSYIPQLQGALANPLLTASYGNFSAPTAAQAAATPGYQFTLDQGLKAAQNSASAKGLGASGAALKGAASYATGLADSTYNDTFNRDLSTYNTNKATFGTNYGIAADNVNRLLGVVGTGQNAAAMTGSLGAQATGNIANTITSGAAASAAGTIGAANGISSGISTAVNGGTNALLLNNLLSGSSSGSNAGTTLYGQKIGSNTYGFTS